MYVTSHYKCETCEKTVALGKGDLRYEANSKWLSLFEPMKDCDGVEVRDFCSRECLYNWVSQEKRKHTEK